MICQHTNTEEHNWRDCDKHPDDECFATQCPYCDFISYRDCEPTCRKCSAFIDGSNPFSTECDACLEVNS